MAGKGPSKSFLELVSTWGDLMESWCRHLTSWQKPCPMDLPSVLLPPTSCFRLWGLFLDPWYVGHNDSPFAPSPPFSLPCVLLSDEFSLKPALLSFPYGSETFSGIPWPEAQTAYADSQCWPSSGPYLLSSQPFFSSPMFLRVQIVLLLKMQCGVFSSSVTHHPCAFFRLCCCCCC